MRMNDTQDIVRIDRFWRACGQLDRPFDAAGAWRSLPAPGDLPSPWLTWTLIALVRHRRRQAWVGELVRKRLGGDLGLLAACGALGHPDWKSPCGTVPGLPEWEYYFHGIGCCLTHRVTGEEIDVDFFGDHAEGFSYFFFQNFLRSLRNPEPPEQRLIELHPSLEPIRLAFDHLHALGLLTTTSECSAPCLTESVVTRAELIDDFCARWNDPAQRPWLGALIGDWIAAEKYLADSALPALRSLVTERAGENRRSRAEQMRQEFDRPGEVKLALLALSDLGADELPDFLTRTLRGDVSGATSTALDLIEASPRAHSWCAEVFALWQRVEPKGQAPHPYHWARCSQLLLRQGYHKKEVAASLPLVSGSFVGEIALLALEHAPEVALGLIRCALRSHVPANRMTAAAVLALIDKPWSRGELLAVLRESDDQEATCECRAALLESCEPEVRRAVEDWEVRNPREPEIGPWITRREMSLRHRPQWLIYEMDKLHERVRRLSLPPELRS
jgi:hypothetical protein